MLLICLRGAIFCLLLTVAQSLSALRFGSDTSENDIGLQYISNAGLAFLTMDSSFQYLASTFAMCFRELSFSIDSSDSTRCWLKSKNSFYQCLEYSNSSSTISYYYFELSEDFSVISNLQAYTPYSVVSGTNFGSYKISLNGTLVTQRVQNYLSNNQTVYYILSNTDRHFYGSSYVKKNYASTIPMALNRTIENMLMQRNYQCFVYEKNFVTTLFYGGVYRFGTEIMIFGLTTGSLNNSNFGAWIGISFSQSHSFRDMMGVIVHSGTLYDMYSLVADAPYDDTSSNIGGSNDYTLLYSSGQQSQSSLGYYYFTQFYRYYSTNSAGDQDIIYKMQNKYCIASYFQGSTNASTFSGVPTSSSYKHQAINCFSPDVTLGQYMVSLQLVLIFLICLL